MKSGIYCIRNLINGKVYVGSSTSLKKRQYKHWWELRNGSSRCLLLQHAWDKYGADAFAFAVLEPCEPGVLLDREDWWIENLGARDRGKGYNIGSAVRGRTGIPHSAETKAKIGAANSGKSPSPETRAKMAEAKRIAAAEGRHNALGHQVSDEWKAAHSVRMKGRTITPEQRARLSAALTGKKASQEAIAKRSASLKGRTISPEQRAKISAANKGKVAHHWSAESRAKLSESLKANPALHAARGPLSVSTKAKISAVQKANTAMMEQKAAAMQANQYAVGYHHTEEAKAKIGTASRGNQYAKGHSHPQSAETRAKISATKRAKQTARGG